MARPPVPGLTERELLLLKILWAHGPSTVKQIREALPIHPKPAHTSIQTNLQGMLDKNYVTRTEHPYAHQYAAAIKREDVERHAIHDLLHRVFDGNATRLLSTALLTEKTSPEEIQHLQELLNQRLKGE